ncbi:MAG: sigma-70 family RNA polymerase sigma factor [Acidiphilium sp.]|nr:sigma-70 family RNA polymerase sigma factor [Acidiphilium sp.]
MLQHDGQLTGASPTPSPELVLEQCGSWIRRCAARLHDRMPWAEIDDLTQQGIMTALELRMSWDETRNVPFPLFVKPRVFGSMIDMLRQIGSISRNSNAVGRELAPGHDEPMTEHDALDIIVYSEDIERLAAEIGRLPYQEKTVISLFYFEELSNREIAVVMKLSEASSTRLRQKAIANLARRIDPSASHLQSSKACQDQTS